MDTAYGQISSGLQTVRYIILQPLEVFKTKGIPLPLEPEETHPSSGKSLPDKKSTVFITYVFLKSGIEENRKQQRNKNKHKTITKKIHVEICSRETIFSVICTHKSPVWKVKDESSYR